MLIEIRNLTKSFQKGDETITPLRDVSLDIDDGEFVSLMGPSGTGKSTLLNQIAGIDKPTSGTITVNETEITTISRSRLAKWRAANVGYFFQTHNLIPVLTAYENVELPLLLLPFNRVAYFSITLYLCVARCEETTGIDDYGKPVLVLVFGKTNSKK